MCMKKLSLLAVGILCSTMIASAQFKSQLDQQGVSQSLVHPSPSLSSFLGILNPENFMMRHSFSFNYLTGGGQGLSLATYTNSMFYKIADPLNVRFDVTLQGSPFGSYGPLQQNDLNRVYLSRAELNYHPADNLFIKFEYNQSPFSRYYYDRYAPTTWPSAYGDE